MYVLIRVCFLQSGGNAVDAAVAIGAALNLTEGMSTGLGGDCFILYKPAGDPQVYALNGSGRSAASLTAAQVRADCAKSYGIEDADSIEEFPGDRNASRELRLALLLLLSLAWRCIYTTVAAHADTGSGGLHLVTTRPMISSSRDPPRRSCALTVTLH